MTHAESQDLLLDLAYGELDAERAAAVASHVEACAECRAEKAALDEARRLAAPVRELEEPSAGFDERILAAARVQAKLEHGNVGRVIEVTGSVRPMGMEAARIDAHGPVKARSAERRRPRWLVRAAVGGSVAAAAALALVVNTSLEARRVRERAVAARSDDYQIRVQPTAPQSVDGALRDAQARRESDRGEPAKVEPEPQPAPAAEALQQKPAQVKEVKPRRPAASMEGGGGDVANRVVPPPEAPAMLDGSRLRRKQQASEAKDLQDVDKLGYPGGAVSAPKSAATPAAAEPRSAKSAAPAQAAVSAPSGGALAAGGIEANAQEARHGGDYLRAASLYRQAAALRQRDDDAAGAAWDLAHAVECLSAAGQFDEARGVRDELARSYPAETSALSAARRALREAEPPAPASK